MPWAGEAASVARYVPYLRARHHDRFEWRSTSSSIATSANRFRGSTAHFSLDDVEPLRLAAILLITDVMRTITLGVALLLTATPGFSQTRVYTNADLTPTPVTRWTRTVTPEELASLAARQFRLPQAFDGPTVIIIGERQDMEPLPPYRPLSEPFFHTSYPGHYGYGFSSRPSWRGVGGPGAHPSIRTTAPVSERVRPSVEAPRPVHVPAAAGGARVRR